MTVERFRWLRTKLRRVFRRGQQECGRYRDHITSSSSTMASPEQSTNTPAVPSNWLVVP